MKTNGTWKDWEEYGVGNNYYTYSENSSVSYGSSVHTKFNVNLPIGIYLILVQSQASIDANASLLVDFSGDVSGISWIATPTFRGTAWAGGGLSAWAICNVTTDRNNYFHIGSYGYINSTYTQSYRVVAIKIYM